MNKTFMRSLILGLAMVAASVTVAAHLGTASTPNPIVDPPPDLPPFDRDGGEDPWPLGEECPFPWEKMNGLWKTMGLEHPMYIQFKVLGKTGKGGQLFSISVLNEDHELVAKGRGFANQGDRVVRAAVRSLKDVAPATHDWAILRTFSRDGANRLCAEDSQVTALTLRSLQAEPREAKDRHYELEKVEQ